MDAVRRIRQPGFIVQEFFYRLKRVGVTHSQVSPGLAVCTLLDNRLRRSNVLADLSENHPVVAPQVPHSQVARHIHIFTKIEEYVVMGIRLLVDRNV